MRYLLDKLLVKLFNIHPVKATDVFTPTTSAEINYVKRPLLESIITKTLLTPGKQLLLFGHSGSGKTTLIRRVLKNNRINSIKTHCEAASTFNDIIYAAFDSLNKYVVEEKSSSSTHTIKGCLAAEYKQISTEISKEVCEENGTKMVRLLPPQLTPQKLAQFFGEGDLVWIIEDFHKVNSSEKKKIADLLKIFVDNSNDYKVSKVVCIGACENATDLAMLEPDLKTRVDEVKVHMLSEEEIRTLISNGCTLLNLDMESGLLDKISYYSSHIASTAHQMCLDICLSKGIDKRQWYKGHLEDIDFNTAVEGYVKANEGTFSNAYDVAVRNELGWYVLKTFSVVFGTITTLSIIFISFIFPDPIPRPFLKLSAAIGCEKLYTAQRLLKICGQSTFLISISPLFTAAAISLSNSLRYSLSSTFSRCIIADVFSPRLMTTPSRP